MATQKQIFRDYLKKNGFHLSPVLSTISLVPHLYKDAGGNHNLVTNIDCCLFDGVDTKAGDLGCVTFYYGGTQRLKYHQRAHSAELLKKAFCPKTAKEAITAFEVWRKATTQELVNWTLVQ